MRENEYSGLWRGYHSAEIVPENRRAVQALQQAGRRKGSTGSHRGKTVLRCVNRGGRNEPDFYQSGKTACTKMRCRAVGTILKGDKDMSFMFGTAVGAFVAVIAMALITGGTSDDS